jgi:hypothetical protein
MIHGKKTVQITWNADKAVTGEVLALVIFADRTFEYIPHNEFRRS